MTQTPAFRNLKREEFLGESASSIVKSSSASNGTATANDFDDGYASDGGYSSDGGGGGGGDYSGFSDGEGGGYLDAVGDRDGEWGGDVSVAPISLEDAFRDKPQTYEDLCRSHIVSAVGGWVRTRWHCLLTLHVFVKNVKKEKTDSV